MPFVVPFTSDPSQSFVTELGGQRYAFAARYNDRSGVWTFDLTRDGEETELVSGVPILIGQDMLAPYALGIGGLCATDLSNAGLDAGPEDLGSRVIVSWLSPDELAAVAALGGVL